ncbi:MAG: hypothetical protein IJB55_02270, partial [Firmicutes bacterium]|nr:hypothetical protein [Bacillota bacterium]
MANKLLIALYALPYSWLWLQAWYFLSLHWLYEDVFFVLGIGLVLLLLLIPLLLAGYTAKMLSWRQFWLLRCVDVLIYAVLAYVVLVGFDSFEMILFALILLVPIALVPVLLQATVRFCYLRLVDDDIMKE